MPKFEHFPLQEIMKEGVRRQDDDDDCVETNMPFGGFDDWSLDDNSYDDNQDDYGDDYVQPTKKPLIFKELLNTKPLSARGYESKRYLVVCCKSSRQFMRQHIFIVSDLL